LILACGLLFALWTSWTAPESACHAPSAADAPDLLASVAPAELSSSHPTVAVEQTESTRGTTWLVLRVSAAESELVTTIHKDTLPYAPGPATADANTVRFRLIDPSGAEITGPCSWPRLCPCDETASHTRGCIRIPHSGSVRLRLPRVHTKSTVVIEQRSSHGWSSLASLEVDA